MRAWFLNCNQGALFCPLAKIAPYERRTGIAPRRNSYQQRSPADGWKQKAGGSFRNSFSAFGKNAHYTSGTTQWGPLQSVIPFSQEVSDQSC